MAVFFNFTCVSLVTHWAICATSDACVALEVYETKNNDISLQDGDFINITFGVNTSSCPQINTIYKIGVKTISVKGQSEEDGRVEVTRESCVVTTSKHVTCTGDGGHTQLYRKFNRTHTNVEWKLWWKEDDLFKTFEKRLKLNVYYPPMVTSLTADGKKIDGPLLVSENQTVLIECSFDQGKPPSRFRLLNLSRQEVALGTFDGHITNSVTVEQCDHSWPRFFCEGDDSKKNKSVVFLVRCPPKFFDGLAAVLVRPAYKVLMFNMTAHTKAIERCRLTPQSLESSSGREVNCFLTGIPPDLVLEVQLFKDDNSFQGNWTLSVRNEIGVTKTTIYFNETATPMVTSLTADGKEVDGPLLVSENQTVLIKCSFDQGKPPSRFRLLNLSRQEVALGTFDGHITYSVTVEQCDHSWPRFFCEGDDSKKNKSVVFLVRCPPKFFDGLAAVLVRPAYKVLMFNMTAHTKAIERCRLTPQSLESSSGREVNCFLAGIPPDLVLEVQLFKDDNSFQGNWTLSVRNEIGVTETTIYFNETEDSQRLQRRRQFF